MPASWHSPLKVLGTSRGTKTELESELQESPGAPGSQQWEVQKLGPPGERWGSQGDKWGSRIGGSLDSPWGDTGWQGPWGTGSLWGWSHGGYAGGGSLSLERRVWAEALRVRGLRARAAPESSQASPRPWCPTGHYCGVTDAPARRPCWCHPELPHSHKLHVHSRPSIQAKPQVRLPQHSCSFLPPGPGHAMRLEWAWGTGQVQGAAPLLTELFRQERGSTGPGRGSRKWGGLARTQKGNRRS